MVPRIGRRWSMRVAARIHVIIWGEALTRLHVQEVERVVSEELAAWPVHEKVKVSWPRQHQHTHRRVGKGRAALTMCGCSGRCRTRSCMTCCAASGGAWRARGA
jgi:hypothetical protein